MCLLVSGERIGAAHDEGRCLEADPPAPPLRSTRRSRSKRPDILDLEAEVVDHILESLEGVIGRDEVHEGAEVVICVFHFGFLFVSDAKVAAYCAKPQHN